MLAALDRVSGARPWLVRAGVGMVRIVDRDFVELSNLQRQVLYDERDVAEQLPKAEAAARKLRQINSDVAVEPIVADLTSENILALAEGMQVIVDGTDNFETRFLVNDLAFERGIPWVHGGCVGCHGHIRKQGEQASVLRRQPRKSRIA